MFIGHALLAFALVGATAARLRDRQTGLRLGVLAGAFAAIPDVDMSYALVGLLGADGGAFAYANAFWGASTLVHRAMTHSLVVAPVIAALAGLWLVGRRRGATGGRLARWGAGALGVGLTAVATLTSGPLGGLVMTVFVVAAVAVAEATVRQETVSPRTAVAVALVGLLSHPFGDLFTGEPPALFYPFELPFLTERVALSTDPTLHLLGAFGVELAAIWAGVAVGAYLLDRSLFRAVDGRAVVGVGYAAAALVIPAPTLDLSYPFVFSVLAVGVVGAAPRFRLPDWEFERPDAFGALATGLAAVTTAGVAYALAYLFL